MIPLLPVHSAFDGGPVRLRACFSCVLYATASGVILSGFLKAWRPPAWLRHGRLRLMAPDVHQNRPSSPRLVGRRAGQRWPVRPVRPGDVGTAKPGDRAAQPSDSGTGMTPCAPGTPVRRGHMPTLRAPAPRAPDRRHNSSVPPPLLHLIDSAYLATALVQRPRFRRGLTRLSRTPRLHLWVGTRSSLLCTHAHCTAALLRHTTVSSPSESEY